MCGTGGSAGPNAAATRSPSQQGLSAEEPLQIQSEGPHHRSWQLALTVTSNLYDMTHRGAIRTHPVTLIQSFIYDSILL